MTKVFYIFFLVTVTQSLPYDNLKYETDGSDKFLLQFEPEKNQSFHTAGVVQTLFGANITLQTEPIEPNYPPEKTIEQEFLPPVIASSLIGHTNGKNPTKRAALTNSPLSTKSKSTAVLTSLLGESEQKKKHELLSPGISSTLLGQSNQKVINKPKAFTPPEISRNLEPPINKKNK